MEEAKAMEAKNAAASKAAAVESRLRGLRKVQRQSLTIEDSEFLASANALADECDRAQRAVVSLQASQHLSLLADFHSDPARAVEETAAVHRQHTTWASMPGLLV
jgi:hypothetical protein